MPASSRTHLGAALRTAIMMCIATVLETGVVYAQDAPLRMPAPDAFDEMVTTLRGALNPAYASRVMRAQRCELDGVTWRCVCGQIDARWSYGQLIRDDAGDAELLQLRDALGRWHVESLQLSQDSWTARGLWWRDDAGGWLRIDVARPLQLETLSWHDPLVRARQDKACASSPEVGPARSTAMRAIARDERWQLETLHISWIQLRDPAPTDARQDGLLSPTLRVNARGFEYSHGVGLRALPFIPLALASPRRWYGAGALLTSEAPTHRALELSGVWDHRDGFGYGLFGQALWGQPAGIQLSVDMEHANTAERRELRRLEQGTWLRGWQSARVGLGLSTESASLWGGWSADSNMWSGPDQQRLSVGLSDAIKLSEASAVELSAQHIVRYGEARATQQRSDLLAGWRAGWGSRRRMYLELGAHGDLSLETSDGEERWRTDIAGRVVAHTLAGVAVAGRINGLTHTISPALIGMFSPAALERRSAVGGAVMITQQLYADPSDWQLDAPLGLWVDQRDDRESGTRWMPYGQLRARWNVAGWETRAEGLIVCLNDCAWRRGMIVAKARPRHDGLGVELWHGAMELELIDWIAQLQLATGGLFGVRAQQRFMDEPLTAAAPRISGGGLTWRRQRHAASVTGWHTTQVHGAWGGYTFTLSELGWRLGAHGGWSSDGRWTSWLGFTL